MDDPKITITKHYRERLKERFSYKEFGSPKADDVAIEAFKNGIDIKNLNPLTLYYFNKKESFEKRIPKLYLKYIFVFERYRNNRYRVVTIVKIPYKLKQILNIK